MAQCQILQCDFFTLVAHTQGQIQELSKGEGRMASAGAWAYNGGLGRSPQRGPGAEPLSHLWVSTMYQSRQLEAFFATFYDVNYHVKS